MHQPVFDPFPDRFAEILDFLAACTAGGASALPRLVVAIAADDTDQLFIFVQLAFVVTEQGQRALEGLPF